MVGSGGSVLVSSGFSQDGSSGTTPLESLPSVTPSGTFLSSQGHLKLEHLVSRNHLLVIVFGRQFSW